MKSVKCGLRVLNIWLFQLKKSKISWNRTNLKLLIPCKKKRSIFGKAPCAARSRKPHTKEAKNPKTANFGVGQKRKWETKHRLWRKTREKNAELRLERKSIGIMKKIRDVADKSHAETVKYELAKIHSEVWTPQKISENSRKIKSKNSKRGWSRRTFQSQGRPQTSKKRRIPHMPDLQQPWAFKANTIPNQKPTSPKNRNTGKNKDLETHPKKTISEYNFKR